jgi:hypothetical protein
MRFITILAVMAGSLCLAEESPESKAQSQRKAYPNLSITIRNKDGVIENLNLKKWRRSFCNYGVAGQNKTTVSIDIPEADYESFRKMVVAMLKLKQPLHRDAEVVVSVSLLASPGEYEHWGIDRNSHTFGCVPGDSGEIERIYTATTKLLDKHRVLQNKNSEQDSGGKGEGRP